MSDEQVYRRREFFTRALLDSARSSIEKINARVERRMPSNFITPPGAIDFASFVDKCSRCGECADACPHNVIEITDESNALLAGLPQLMLSNNPCRLCDDAPCIKICSTGVLVSPKSGEAPRLGMAVVDPAKCLAAIGGDCDICARECGRREKAIDVSRGAAPSVDVGLCNGCGFCEKFCPAPAGAAITVRRGGY